jgi:hypothetical protein
VRRRRLTIVLLGITAILAVPALSGASIVPNETTTPNGFFRFCAEAQATIANVDETKLISNGGNFTIFNTVYKSENDFVFSKSSVNTSTKRINTSQWTLYTDSAQTQPKLLRCKLRTGESFTAGNWPNGSSNNSSRFVVEPVFGFGSAGTGLSTNPSTDQTCEVVNQQTIDNVWGSLTNTQKNSALYNPTNSNLPGASANTLVTVADTVVSDGPSWTPDVAAISTSGPVAQVGSRALVATSNSTGNARFEGAHYCTLVAPEFLKRVLLGEVSPS